MNAEIRKLYRRRGDVPLAGLCAGLGQYLGVDPVFVRLVLVAASIFTGVLPGILVYVAGWILVPLEPAAPVPRPAGDAGPDPVGPATPA